MCGRYRLKSHPKYICSSFGLPPTEEMFNRFSLGYNLAPGEKITTIGLNGSVYNMIWGYPPYGNINARSDSLHKTLWMNSGRCGVIADGWYEWQSGLGGKQPYQICLKGGDVFAMAAICTRVSDQLYVAIITEDAGIEISHIHNRQPIPLLPEELEPWLSWKKLPNVNSRKYDYWAVSKYVNDPELRGRKCMEPV